MSAILLVSIALTALVGALCTLLYRQQVEFLRRQAKMQQQISKVQDLVLGLGVVVTEIEQQATQNAVHQEAISVRLEHLATDLMQRDIYQSAEDRHQLAIQGAKQGMDLFELMQRHGLSSDEAALILSLHAPERRAGNLAVEQASAADSTVVDVI